MALPSCSSREFSALRKDTREARPTGIGGFGGFPMAERENGHDGATGLVYHPPSVRPFLDRAAKLDQGKSRVFNSGTKSARPLALFQVSNDRPELHHLNEQP
jgi:hypothetical protein